MTASTQTTGDIASTRRKYDRIASVYDRLEAPMEHMVGRWRADLWQHAPPGKLLEVGVGTGKSVPLYPADAQVTAIDISPRMLERAQRRATELHRSLDLRNADVQQLPFAESSFAAAFTTCVFCSVPDPVRGLREIHRVLVPGGRLFMLEHVLSHRPLLRWLMRAFDFIPAHLWGAHINRDTVANVKAGGFVIEREENLVGDVVKLIVATKTAASR